MATTIYDVDTIELVDGTPVEISPLKIKYLRSFLEAFELVKFAKNDDQAIFFLSECARISMKQYYPSIQTIFDLEENLDLPTIYKIIDIAAGIKVSKNSKDSVKKQATESGSTWETLDLAKLEAEVFLLGIWKNYDELETSISMPELLKTLEVRRELDYNEKKFLAGIQGVDLDKQSGKQDAWEEMKARVFSKGKTNNPNDIVALQGQNAVNAGFGIGMGLQYEDLTKK